MLAEDNVAFVKRTSSVRSQMNEFRDSGNGSRGNYSLAVCLTVRWTRVARGYGSRSVTFRGIVRRRIWNPSRAAASVACSMVFWRNCHHEKMVFIAQNRSCDKLGGHFSAISVVAKYSRNCQPPSLKSHWNTRLAMKIRPTWRKFSKSQQNALTTALMMKRHQLRSESEN